MPKRSKKQGQADHEGRPPNLTLASFVQFPGLASSGSSSTERKNNAIITEEKKENQASQVSVNEAVSQPDISLSISATETVFTKTEKLNPIYLIGKTKKGKLPLTCESRAKGKKVTVIGNVSGDASALLSELKKRAGCGGVIREQGTVELQGDRVKFLSQFLAGHPCLKPYKS